MSLHIEITQGLRVDNLQALQDNQPFQGAKFTNFVEIDVSGLNIIQGRSGVFVVPNEVPLNLSGRIISSGAVPIPVTVP